MCGYRTECRNGISQSSHDNNVLPEEQDITRPMFASSKSSSLKCPERLASVFSNSTEVPISQCTITLSWSRLLVLNGQRTTVMESTLQHAT